MKYSTQVGLYCVIVMILFAVYSVLRAWVKDDDTRFCIFIMIISLSIVFATASFYDNPEMFGYEKIEEVEE